MSVLVFVVFVFVVAFASFSVTAVTFVFVAEFWGLMNLWQWSKQNNASSSGCDALPVAFYKLLFLLGPGCVEKVWLRSIIFVGASWDRAAG